MPYLLAHDDLFVVAVTGLILILLALRWTVTRKHRRQSDRPPEV
jgi:hypothetical protein